MKWNQCYIVSGLLNAGKDLGIENSGTVQLITLLLSKTVYWALKFLEPLLLKFVFCCRNGIVLTSRNTVDHPGDYKTF